MKTTSTFIFCCLFLAGSFGQSNREKELSTQITEVTVFLSGAQIFASGAITVPVGTTLMHIKGLSPYLDEKSIQVKADGDLTILSVNHKFNHINELRKDAKADSIRKVMEGIGAKIELEKARLAVLEEQQHLLAANRSLGGQHAPATMVQLKQAMEFYDREMTRIKDEQIRTSRSIEEQNRNLTRLELELKELDGTRLLPSSEIEIRTSAERAVATKFEISYMVSNAGWYPKYDIRVHDVGGPLETSKNP